jgi:cell wall-associated NlpC family hydrolase
LPHNVQAQSKLGMPVARGKLEPGDLVFYNTRNQPYSHVGIYLGDGRFIHAPRPGKNVRVESLRSPYWRSRFDGARRLIPPT